MNSATISLEIDSIRTQIMREKETTWFKIREITTDRGTVHQIIDILEDGPISLEIITQTEVVIEAVIDVTNICLQVKAGHKAKYQDSIQGIGLLLTNGRDKEVTQIDTAAQDPVTQATIIEKENVTATDMTEDGQDSLTIITQTEAEVEAAIKGYTL